jgi:tRNA (uracil-5-)-methyltransferase
VNCKHFGTCGSCTIFDKTYTQQVYLKKQFVYDEFSEFIENIEVKFFTSQDIHFRSRAEFRIYHEGDDFFYAMNSLEKKILPIESCQIVSKNIFDLMPKLKSEILKSNILKHKLFAAEFTTSQTNEVLVTLIYHKLIDEVWLENAKKLTETLNIKLIGRSRKKKIVVNEDFLNEKLNIDGKSFDYTVQDGSFSQPNTPVNEKMISWVKSNVKNENKDFLELYCGHGNFTISLAQNFRKVLATEVSKSSINAAIKNTELNNINNIDFIRLSSEELTQAINKQREFNRLKGINLDDFNFETVLVDPPRAGLDEGTTKLVQNFEKIVYISCNPQTLKRDLQTLTQTHKVVKFATFDQFAYTHHLECGVVLSMNSEQ